MHLINTGVDHIRSHRTPQVMEDQSACHVPALVNSGPITRHLEGIFNTPLL
jgi:putative transposase